MLKFHGYFSYLSKRRKNNFLNNLLSFCREVMVLSCLPLNRGAHLTVCPGPTPASTGWICHPMKAFFNCAVSSLLQLKVLKDFLVWTSHKDQQSPLTYFALIFVRFCKMECISNIFSFLQVTSDF